MTRFFLIFTVLASICLIVFFPTIFTYFTLFYTLALAIMAFTYKSCSKEHQIKCDIIIPAFNEGKHILETVKSVMESDYKNFRILVIDDGSTDDTRKWIHHAENMFPDTVTAVCYDKNRGKKHALAEGIRTSSAEVIVTIDSDSVVARDAIGNILRPFVKREVGAVAGNINVQNLNTGLIPKLMDIIFVFSYELFRSAQSQFGSVMCTPGALSAYRREAIVPMLDEWLQQKFLGNYTTIGEDRALTCLLIRNRWDVVYQESAKAYTNMPEKYGDLCRMLLRWIRGDMRENILLSPYIFKNASFSNIKSLGLVFHFIVFNIGTFSPIIIIPLLLIYYIFNIEAIFTLLPSMLLIMVLWSTLPTIIYMRKKSAKYAFHSITYSLFSLLLLSWIPCYAVFTLSNNKWLTRGSDEK